jgi:hypothetical protein
VVEDVAAMTRLARMTVRGFKSIWELEDFKLERLNVLIGANGAGKSNFDCEPRSHGVHLWS